MQNVYSYMRSSLHRHLIDARYLIDEGDVLAIEEDGYEETEPEEDE